MKAYFINYDPNMGISINAFRNPAGYFNSDVIGLVEDVIAGRPSCAPLEGSLDALEDGSLWSDRQQSIIEALHCAIKQNEYDQACITMNTRFVW